MEAKELRAFSVDELKGRVKQWKEDLFRSKFKTQSSEARDTSVIRKLKRDIARGLTILNEKSGTSVAAAPAQDKKEVKK
jgi:large subunit ribosomal protein L29